MEGTRKDVKDASMPQVHKVTSSDFNEGEIVVEEGAHHGHYGFSGDQVELALRGYAPNTQLEKKMIRKVDLSLLPMLWLMCVMAYVDRNNIGNANAAGMSEDIGLSDNQYAFLISIFFIAYLVWEVPSNMILARVRPSWYLSGLMITWGAVCCAMSKVKNSRDILVCRFFLGMIEAGFFPGVLYIMSCWYKRNEIGKRFSLFYTAICFSGAAAGLIAGAVISGLEGHGGIAGWRWLFLIEGLVTIGIGILAKFVLLDYPHIPSKRLTPEERAISIARIMHDKQETEIRTRKLNPWQSFKAAIVDLRMYVFIAVYVCQNSATSVSYFIPTVLKSMGYTGTSAQWMTVPIWATGTAVLLLLPQSSDRFKERRWHIVGGLSVAWISAVVGLTCTSNDKVRYAFMCLYIGGLYPTAPLILSWVSETLSLPAEKRAVCIAITNSIGSASAIYASYFWPSSDAPRYKTGFACVISFIGVSLILAASVPLIFRVLPKFTTKAERELEIEEEVQARS
ncbi:putative transporter [Exophiala dermatitidis]